MSCWSLPTRAAEIRWLGADDCRRVAEVQEQIEAMTQRLLPSVESADFELEPQRLESGAFELQLTSVSRTSGARETRVMRGATCAEVTDAAAVAIALAVGPDPAEASQVATTPPAPASPPPKVRRAPRRDSALRDSKGPTPAGWLLGLSATLDAAVTPHPVLGAALHLAFRWRALRGELEAGAFAPSTTLDASQRGGTFQLLYAAPRVCGTANVGRPRVALCVAYELGRLSAEGEGVAHPYSRSTFWHAVRPDLGVALPLTSGLWLSGRGGAALALARDTFVLEEPETVHRAPWLSLRAAVGLELEL